MKLTFYIIECFLFVCFMSRKLTSHRTYNEYLFSYVTISLKEFPDFIIVKSNNNDFLSLKNRNQFKITYEESVFKYIYTSQFKHVYSNKCLSIIKNNNNIIKRKINLMQCNNNYYQHWKLVNNKIKNIETNECIFININHTNISESIIESYHCSKGTQFKFNEIHFFSSFIEINNNNNNNSKFLSNDLLLKLEDTINQLTDKIINLNKQMETINNEYSIIQHKLNNSLNNNNNSYISLITLYDELNEKYKQINAENTLLNKIISKEIEINDNIKYSVYNNNYIPTNSYTNIFKLNEHNNSWNSFFYIKDTFNVENGPSNWKQELLNNTSLQIIENSGIKTNNNTNHSASILEFNKPIDFINNHSLINITIDLTVDFGNNVNSFINIHFTQLSVLYIYYSHFDLVFNQTLVSSKQIVDNNKTHIKNINITFILNNYNQIEIKLNNDDDNDDVLFSYKELLVSPISSNNNILFSLGINAIKYISINNLDMIRKDLRLYPYSFHLETFVISNDNESNSNNTDIINETVNSFYLFKQRCYEIEEESLCNYVFNFIQDNQMNITLIGTFSFRQKLYNSCINKIHNQNACNDIIIKLIPVLNQLQVILKDEKECDKVFLKHNKITKEICVDEKISELLIKHQCKIKEYCSVCCYNNVSYGNDACKLCQNSK